MRVSDRLILFLAIWVILLFGTTRSVHAYIDPGTGSFVLQVLIAGIAASSLAIKLFWRKIRSVFSRSSPDQPNKSSNNG